MLRPLGGCLVLTLLLSGDLVETRKLLEPLYAPLLETPPRLRAYQSISEPNISGTSPWVLWALGYPDQALRVGQANLAMAHASEVPFYVAWVLHDGICFPHQLRREVAPMEQALQRVRPAGPATGPPLHEGVCHAVPGLGAGAAWGAGAGDRDAAPGAGAVGAEPPGVAALLEGLPGGGAGQGGARGRGLGRAGGGAGAGRARRRGLEPAGGVPADGRTAETRRGETRGLGDGETRREGDEAAEAWFRKAIEVARGQEAKSWELRATTSLARLLREQGRAAEAREMLAAIYGWFTEGFDTPDLVEAKALLDTLQG